MEQLKGKRIKLTGSNSIIKFSDDGTLIAVGAYDGGFKVFDVSAEKAIFKTKIKGPKREVMIHNIAISFDNQYCAFSCLSKVYIVELASKQIIKELLYDVKLERQATIPFCFFNQAHAVAIPNGEEIILYTINEDKTIVLPLFEGTGTTEMLAISPDDQYLAYKSMNHKICDKLFIYKLADKKLLNTIELPYEYVPGKQMFACHFKFVGKERVAVMRQSYGLSIFDVQTAEELKAVTWETMGFRSMGNHRYRISNDGRYLLINKEQSRNGDDNLVEWSVSDDNCVFVVYDTERSEIVYSVKNGLRSADFNMRTGLIAIQHYDWEQEKRNRQSLKIFAMDEN